MSHITAVKTELRDGEILRRALEGKGYRVRDATGESDSKERGMAGVEFFASNDGVRLGFTRDNPGECYRILADWVDQGKKADSILKGIVQSYSREKVIDGARRRGYAIVKNRVLENGSIEIVLRKLA